MAAPNDLDPDFREDRRHACGLRIMEEDDVPGANPFKESDSVGRRDVRVVGRFGWAECSVVAFHTMESVVDPFRDRKEGRIPLDDDPPSVNSRAQDVADEDPEHLSDATPGGGRVDVPDDVAGKSGPGRVGRGLESSVTSIADQGAEGRDRLGRHLDLAKLRHGPQRVGDCSASGRTHPAVELEIRRLISGRNRRKSRLVTFDPATPARCRSCSNRC